MRERIVGSLLDKHMDQVPWNTASQKLLDIHAREWPWDNREECVTKHWAWGKNDATINNFQPTSGLCCPSKQAKHVKNIADRTTKWVDIRKINVWTSIESPYEKKDEIS